jgi:hypothetical protein
MRDILPQESSGTAIEPGDTRWRYAFEGQLREERVRVENGDVF